MRISTKIRWAVSGVALSILASMPAGADTLADALVSAYNHSNLLEQNRALLRASDENVQQAIAALGPVVNFVAQASANSAGSPVRALGLSLTATMPLYDFGRGRLNVQATHEQVLATRAALINVEQSVLLNAANAYLGLYSALQKVELQRNNVSVISEQLRAARERFDLGDSTRTNVSITEAQLAAARSALTSAQGNAAVAREAYRLAVGVYPSHLAAPPSLPRLPASLAAAQDIARRNHPSIIQVQHQVSAADLATQIISRQRLGSVNGTLSAQQQAGQASNLTPSYNTGSVTASVQYAVPIYNGGATASAERQAIANAEAQRAQLNQTVAVVHQSVAASWAQLQIARAALQAAGAQVAASQQAYDSVRAEADLGSLTILDVFNAEQELLTARSNRILAANSLQTAAYALLNAMGQMTVQALNLGIPTYDVEAYAVSAGHRPARSVQGSALDRILGRAPAGQ